MQRKQYYPTPHRPVIIANTVEANGCSISTIITPVFNIETGVTEQVVEEKVQKLIQLDEADQEVVNILAQAKYRGNESPIYSPVNSGPSSPAYSASSPPYAPTYMPSSPDEFFPSPTPSPPSAPKRKKETRRRFHWGYLNKLSTKTLEEMLEANHKAWTRVRCKSGHKDEKERLQSKGKALRTRLNGRYKKSTIDL